MPDQLMTLTPPGYLDHSVEDSTPYNIGRHITKVTIVDFLPEDLKYWSLHSSSGDGSPSFTPPRITMTLNSSISFLLTVRLEWNHQALPLPEEEVGG